MAAVDLSVELFPGLILTDPFMIASSHWTATEANIQRFAELRPAALTLKTTSQKHGGGPKNESGTGRRICRLCDWNGREFARYTDGPKQVELWDLATTHDMLRFARQRLPDTKLGLSVLQGEDYDETANALDVASCDYVEMNLKYSLRNIPAGGLADAVAEIEADVDAFLASFHAKPVLVKLCREAAPLLYTDMLRPLLDKISAAGAGLIIANSRKMLAPPSRNAGQGGFVELSNGVVVGEYLFMETYNLLRTVQAGEGGAPVVAASGGVVDIGHVIDALGAGALAIQLCTIFDIRQVRVLEWLRDQLRYVCGQYGSLTDLRQAILSGDEGWANAIRTAHETASNETALIASALGQRETVTEMAASALKAECEGGWAEVPAPAAVALPPDTTFVISRGNISSFVLGASVVDELDLQTSFIDSAYNLWELIQSSSDAYDFSIVPQSTLDFLQRQATERKRPDWEPVAVADVASSVMELVGPPADLKDVAVVYHFGGNSAQAARTELLKTGCHPEFVPISWQALVPLLRTWQFGSAILGKSPLTQYYGLLCQPDMQEQWTQIWSRPEPLVLVSSAHLQQRQDAADITAVVMACVSKHRERILGNALRAARKAELLGFVRHCASLLGLKTEL